MRDKESENRNFFSFDNVDFVKILEIYNYWLFFCLVVKIFGN